MVATKMMSMSTITNAKTLETSTIIAATRLVIHDSMALSMEVCFSNRPVFYF